MKTIFKNTKKTYRRKLLATSVAAVCSMIFTTSVSQASDIEIYQQAKSGQITLLFMIDVSGSMDEKDGGSTTRLSRVKTAMTDLL